MLDINYFKAIQNSQGIYSETKAKIVEAQWQLSQELKSSINRIDNALRNDEHQEFLLLPHEQAKYKCKLLAFPNDDLCVGDLITIGDLHWIIVETNITNPVQTSGVAWLCNHLFRFQNRSSKIIECWGVIDDGSYSLPLAGNSQVKFPNNRVNFYLPYNDDTKYLYIDKRIATDTMYDQFGNNILEVYKIEGKKQTLNTYGKGGHLLVLEAGSGQYNSEKDNITEGICDYISPIIEKNRHGDKISCNIQGRTSLRTGSTNTYSVNFENSTMLSWELSPTINGVTLNANKNTAYVSAENSDSLVGVRLNLSCETSDNIATIEIEVV